MLFETYFRHPGIRKSAVALPLAYQAALGLGAGGLAGGLTYALTGAADPKKKHRLARAIGSTLLGLGVGAGAVHLGNRYTAKKILNDFRARAKLDTEQEANRLVQHIKNQGPVTTFLNGPNYMANAVALDAAANYFDHASPEQLEHDIDTARARGDAPGNYNDIFTVGGLPAARGFFTPHR